VRPGQHLGGIVAENTAVQGSTSTQRPGSRRGGFRIRIRQLTIVAVQVDLPGPQVAAIRIGGVTPGGSGGYQQLFLGLRNTGTVMTKPAGSLLVTDERKQRVARAALRLDTFLPRTRISYPVLVRRKVLPAGRYRAQLVLRYGGRQTRATRWFTIGKVQVTQVYSAPRPAAAPPPARDASGIGTALPWALAAAGLLVGAAAVVVGWRSRRHPT